MASRIAWACGTLTFAVLAIGVVFTLLGRAYAPTDVTIANLGFVPTVTAFGAGGADRRAPARTTASGWICLTIGLLFAIVVAGDAVSTWGQATGSLAPGLCEWLAVATGLWVPALG